MSTVDEHGLADNCILEYFCTLYEMIPGFCISGEEILRQKGYRNRVWVETLFEVAARNHCFITEKCPGGLPFRAVQPFITQDMVADFCLANNILEAAFYEYQMFQQCQKLSSLRPKSSNQAIKDLHIAKRKFRKCKMKYISLAYGHEPAEGIVRIYDTCVVAQNNKMQQNVIAALELMPIVFKLCPRDENAADTVSIRKLCRKYIRLFNICAEFENSHQV